MKCPRNCFLALVHTLIIVIFFSGLGYAENAQDLPTVKWRCQSSWPPPEEIVPGSKYKGGYGMLMEVVRTVEKNTDGKFIIEVFTPNQLIKTKEVLNGLRSGAIDMAASNGAYFGGTIPSANIECMSVGGASDPTVFVSMLTDSDWLEIIRRDYARYGVYYLGPAPAGTSLLMGNFEAHTVDDLKKYKIAATGAKGDLFKNLGVSAVTVHSTDIYPALQRGTIDAVMYSSYCLNTYKFHEVVDHVIWTEIQKPLLSNMVVNLEAYNKLPKRYQHILNGAAMEVAIRQLAGTNEIDDIARDIAEKTGIKQHTFKGEAKEQIRAGILEIWDKYAAMSEDNAKLIEILREYAGY